MLAYTLNTAAATPGRRVLPAGGAERPRHMTQRIVESSAVPGDATELVGQLATVPLFKGLTPDALKPIIALGHSRSMEAGTFFFNEGDEAERFFVLTSGRVKLTQVTPEGHQVVLAHIGAGDAFGGVGHSVIRRIP